MADQNDPQMTRDDANIHLGFTYLREDLQEMRQDLRELTREMNRRFEDVNRRLRHGAANGPSVQPPDGHGHRAGRSDHRSRQTVGLTVPPATISAGPCGST